MSDPRLTPGCIEDGDKFRPIIFEAHGAVYFCPVTFAQPGVAIGFATAVIDEDGPYKQWHSHRLVVDE